MKKLLTLLLTAALAITAATTAFAADTTIGPGTNSKQIDVTYTVNPSYTVTIPANITLTSQTNGTAEGTAKVSATNVTVPYGQSVKVALHSNFQVKLTGVSTTAAPTMSYKVYKVKDPNTKPSNNDLVEDNGTVLEVAPEAAGKTGAATLAFVTDKVVYSGDYEGTVTFTVSVGAKTTT